MKKIPLLLVSALLATVLPGVSLLAAGREEIDLSGKGWTLWRDTDAKWEDDELFAPPVDLSKIPANPPTGGWEQLSPEKGVAAAVPGTAEEYLGDGSGPQTAVKGVTWWFRKVRAPEGAAHSRFILRFESARQRAEVYLDKKLAGYDIVGNTPFEADISGLLKPGQEALLAVRVTNHGGNYSWQDYTPDKWGKYSIPAGHGFGGITGRVKLVACDDACVDDIYLQNTPEPRKARAILTLKNTSSAPVRRDVLARVVEKKSPSTEVFRQEIKNVTLPAGDTSVTVNIEARDTKLWSPEHPELYVFEASLLNDGKPADTASQTFGFRWFAPDGVGQNALLRLNGKRVFICTAISWGFWPVNGIYPTPEWAEKQIRAAKDLGMNMLNFHRCIGNPVVMEKADEMGLLYFEEPGGYVSAGKDPFAQALSREKLLRMVKRDRSHPSVVIYNMINEQWNQHGADKDENLYAMHVRDIQAAHAVDPSRVIAYTSAWMKGEKPKLHMRPFDDKPLYQGWWDHHRATGPECWKEIFYTNPSKHYGFTSNTAEIIYRGEEGAVSAPPRLELIAKEMKAAPRKGWDTGVYLEWNNAFADFIKRKKLDSAFPTVDALCTAMGAISLEHQGRKIQLHRVCDANDGYAINGWEAEIIENHSGIVDCFRNPKADPAIVAYYNQPLYIAVIPRNQVLNAGDTATVDFHIVNEKDLKGAHTLKIRALDPAGKEFFAKDTPVTLSGGDVYGQLLLEGIEIRTPANAGACRIEALLLDAQNAEKARGRDEVFTVDWKSAALTGKGAVLNGGGKVSAFLKAEKKIEANVFDDSQGPLDWIVLDLPAKPTTTVIPAANLRDASGKKGLSAAFFSGGDFKEALGKRTHDTVDFKWTGALPDASVGSIDNYSVRWEGTLVPTVSGEYVVGTFGEGGVRLWLDGKQVINAWQEKKQAKEARIKMEAGKTVPIRLEYFHGKGNAEIHLQWTPPTSFKFNLDRLFERAKNDGTALIALQDAAGWMDLIQKHTAAQCAGTFTVDMNWVGGQYFVREHPLFKALPVNVGMNWPYQAVVSGGGKRVVLNLEGEELVAGAYNTWRFGLGTAVGVIPCGKGRVVVSTLNIADNLPKTDGPAQVARKLLCNYLGFAAKR